MKQRIRKLLRLAVIALAVYAVVITALAVGEILIDSPKRLESVPAEPLTALGSPYKYYFSRLDNVEKHLYNRILSKLYQMPEEIRVPSVNGDQLDHVFSALLKDNPDLIFLGRRCTLISRPFGTFCAMDYCLEPAAYEAQKQKLDAAVQKVIGQLTAPEDAWQTELEIHDYVVEHCVYELEKGDLSYSSAYGALVNGKAACEGYSKAAKLLMDRVGIPCALISGKALGAGDEAGEHMWNVVQLDGNFYHLDCTWDDPQSSDGEPVKIYAFFNVDDAVISATHSAFTPEFDCTHSEESYYVKTGTWFETYDRSQEARLAALMAAAREKGESRLQVRFATAEAYRRAEKQLLEEERIYFVLREAKALTSKPMAADKLLYIKEKKMRILTFEFKTD